MPFRKTKEWGIVKPFQGTALTNESISRGIIGAWPFNEGGGGQLFDISRRLSIGTLNVPVWGVGRFGTTLKFGGSSYVSIPYTTNFNMGNVFALSVWINTSSTAANEWILSFDNNQINSGFELFVAAAGSLSMGLPGNTFANTTGTLSVNTWYHIVVMKNGTGASASSIYLNGLSQALGSNAAATAIDNNVAHILGMRRVTGSVGPFAGKIENLVIWNRLLSVNEIQRLYTEPFCYLAPPKRRIISQTGTPVTLGVIFDSAASSAYEASVSTYSWNHTVANQSNRVLIVSVSIFLTGSVTSITYNSVNLINDSAATVTNGVYRSEVWSLINPSTGTNSVTVTLNTSLTSIANSSSYYNVDQTNPIEATSKNSGTANPASASVITIANNSRVVGNLVTPTASGVSSAGGQNSRDVNSGALGTSALDDTGPVSPAGSTTLTWNGIGSLDTWAVSIISLQVPKTRNVFRRTLSPIGTRTGSRQMHGWSNN